METWEKTLNDMNWAAQSRIQEEQQKRLEEQQKRIEAEKETEAANQRAASADAEIQRLQAYIKANGLTVPEQ